MRGGKRREGIREWYWITVSYILTRANPNIPIFDVESWIRRVILSYRIAESNPLIPRIFEYWTNEPSKAGNFANAYSNYM